LAVRNRVRLAALAAVFVCVLATAGPPARAKLPWMTEDAMHSAFIGKTLDGYYVDGEGWTETYDANGRLDYRDTARSGGGIWFFRDRVFCTFYDPGQDLTGGCFTALRASANCYEFYRADPDEGEDEAAPAGRWVARASRRGEPSTCPGRPTV
jgi:hypothetical protein